MRYYSLQLLIVKFYLFQNLNFHICQAGAWKVEVITSYDTNNLVIYVVLVVWKPCSKHPSSFSNVFGVALLTSVQINTIIWFTVVFFLMIFHVSFWFILTLLPVCMKGQAIELFPHITKVSQPYWDCNIIVQNVQVIASYIVKNKYQSQLEIRQLGWSGPEILKNGWIDSTQDLACEMSW